MKLTLKSALEMYQAVQQLDSYQNGADKPTLYKYDGDTRLQLAIARRKLREVYQDYIDARNKLLLEVTEGEGELPSLAGLTSVERKQAMRRHILFTEKERQLLDGEVAVDIKPLPADRFKLDDNPIPTVVLDLLGPMLEA